jgi:proton glutamate symport protein
MATPALTALGRFFTNPWTVIASIAVGVAVGMKQRELAAALAPYGELYLALLKMCVLPLMMAALVSSLGRLLYKGHASEYLGRLTLVFGVGLLVAALVGIALAAWSGPGRQIDDDTRLQLAQEVLRAEQSGAGDRVDRERESTGLLSFMRSMIPQNVFAAASSGSVLSVVFFCVVAGMALGSLRNDHASAALQVANAAYETMLRVIGWLMYGLPIGLACLVADQVSRTGAELLGALGGLVLTLYLGALVMLLLYTVVISWRTGLGPLRALAAVRGPLIVALGTSSSFAAIPAALRSVNRELGRSRQGGDLVVPLGITLNPQGNVVHFSISALFVAQLYGQSLGLEQLAVVVVASVLTSIAASGAPGVAALGMLTLVLEPLGLPAAVGIILLTAIDPIIDPVLTAVNVHATCASAAVIAESEDEPEEAAPGASVAETA